MLIGGRILSAVGAVMLIGAVVLLLVLDFGRHGPDLEIPAGVAQEVVLKAGDSRDLFAIETGTCTAIAPDGVAWQLPRSGTLAMVNDDYYFSVGRLEASVAGTYTVNCEVAVRTINVGGGLGLGLGLALLALGSCAGIFGLVMWLLGRQGLSGRWTLVQYSGEWSVGGVPGSSSSTRTWLSAPPGPAEPPADPAGKADGPSDPEPSG